MIKVAFQYIQKAFLEEIHNLFLFIPVFMGMGSLIYLKKYFLEFSYIPFAILFLITTSVYLCRKKHYINLINIAIFSITLGVCSAIVDTKLHYTEMLQGENVIHYVEGKVTKITPKQKGHSIIIKLNHDSLSDIEDNKLSNIERVSVKLTKHSKIPNINDEVYLKANLNSPTPSVMQGAYDFRKDSYFKKIGAFGYALSKLYFINKTDSNHVNNIKHSVARKIEKYSSSEKTSEITKALMLGEKKAINKETIEMFRASGISHLLSISGLHIGLIFSFIFLLLRYLTSLNQTITLRYNIKKICASIAIITTLIYVIMINYPTPAVRAFIMISVAYLGIMFDRRAISMRNVAIAGILILLFAPHSILSASFQMSFAAVTALVAAYEYISRKNIPMHGVKGYIAGILFTSFIAILATTPFAIYNFQNFSPYGLITNTFVMPIIGFITMPFIVLSYISLPLGLSTLPLIVIDKSIATIINISEYIAELPSSHILIAPAPSTSMILFSTSMILLCFFKGKLRFLSLITLAVTFITLFTHKDNPDIIISPDAKLIAVRNQDGLLTFSDIEKQGFVADIMRKINGQEEIIPFSENKFINCTDEHCIYIKDNTVVNLNNLASKEYAQQVYIEDGKTITKDIR